METRSSLTRTASAITLALIALLLTATPVLADGIIIPRPPICLECPEPPPPEPVWLTIKYHHVEVTIKDQVAVTHVDQVFINESQWQIEGTYVFPLPVDAAISDFAMWVDGEKFEGELLDRDQARRIYEEIVRQRRDPALLEYIDRGAFRVSIFPIPAGEERQVELEYSQVLPVDGGLVRYTYPLNTERFSARPLEDVSVSVSIDSPDAIKAIYSPSHKVVVDRDGDYRARVGYEERNVLPDQDFELVYTVSPEDVGLNLLSYKDGDADGFFLMLIAPQVEVDETQVVDKDVLLILDTSGSMEGEKLEQAKKSLIFVLEHLNEGDRFNITDFSTGVRQYARNPQPSSQRGEAISWVRGLTAGGGTDINRALLETLASVDPERPTILIFLTDGQPTEGEVETDRILANFANSTRPNVRLFTFGVGDDVNAILLDTLAQEQRGASGYVRPGQRIDEQVSAFYAKVSTPLLADIAIEVDGVHIEDVYPYPLPDLFAGTQLVVVGRYREGGPALIRLTGQVNTRAQPFTYEGYFEHGGGGRLGERNANNFIPRLWATRKIGYLLNQIRLHGENRELVDEIVELSIRYGIVTPYTSYLVQEDADVLTREGRQIIADEEYRAQSAAPAAEVGAEAVEKAVEQEAIRGADLAEAPAGEAAEVVKIVGDKTFVHRNGLWTDTIFDPSQMTTQKVGFGSETYFGLLAARPDMGVYFALGDRVIVVVDGLAYEVAEGDGGPVTLPPTPASGTPAEATPTSRPVSSNTTQPTPTPRPAGSDRQPTPRAGQDQSNRTGPSSLCPGTVLTGLVLVPLAGLGLRRRKRR
jgi:Ca-activated chloride channel family protein